MLALERPGSQSISAQQFSTDWTYLIERSARRANELFYLANSTIHLGQFLHTVLRLISILYLRCGSLLLHLYCVWYLFLIAMA